jgi:hypothetical protein
MAQWKPPVGARLDQRSRLAQGLVGCWLFNEGAGIKNFDISGNNFTGTMTNMAASGSTTSGWRPGKFGPTLLFDASNDFVDITHNTRLNAGANLTVSAWMNSVNATNDMALVAKWDYNTQGSWALQTGSAGDGGANNLQVFIPTTTGDVGGNKVWTTSGNLKANKWQHVAFVYNGTKSTNTTKVRIYIDGVVQSMSSSGTIATSAAAGTASVKIGKFGGSLNRFYLGKIENVRIYNRSLSDDEIKQLSVNPFDGISIPTLIQKARLVTVPASSYTSRLALLGAG